jgi:PHD/YefM family antitoxin component YafN of YafNO toxin-antitoxin module
MESVLSLTELRQRLFELADQVILQGNSVVIMRKGVRLVLKREDAPKTYSRLAKLKVQELEIGPPIRPD